MTVGARINVDSAILGNTMATVEKVFDDGRMFIARHRECMQTFAIVGEDIISTFTASRREKIARLRAAMD